MKTATTLEIKTNLKNYIDECKDAPVVVMENDKAVAVLVSAPEKDDMERFILSHTPAFQKILENGRKNIKETGGMKHDDFWSSI